EELAAGRAVENGVAEEDGVAGVADRRPDDDPAAAHRLADVVVRLPRQLELDARGEERAEALAGGAGETGADAAGRRLPRERPSDLAAEPRADGSVAVPDLVRELEQARL